MGAAKQLPRSLVPRLPFVDGDNGHTALPLDGKVPMLIARLVVTRLVE
jgi:hypothetical protein